MLPRVRSAASVPDPGNRRDPVDPVDRVMSSHEPELSSEFAKFDAKNNTLGPPVISVIVFWHLSAKPGPEN